MWKDVTEAAAKLAGLERQVASKEQELVAQNADLNDEILHARLELLRAKQDRTRTTRQLEERINAFIEVQGALGKDQDFLDATNADLARSKQDLAGVNAVLASTKAEVTMMKKELEARQITEQRLLWAIRGR